VAVTTGEWNATSAESGKAGRFGAEATGRPGGDVGHRQVDVVAKPLIRDGQMVADQLHERPGPGVKVDRRIGALRALGEDDEQTNLAPLAGAVTGILSLIVMLNPFWNNCQR